MMVAANTVILALLSYKVVQPPVYCDGYIFGSLSSSYQIISTQISDFNTGQVLSNTNFGTGLCSGVYKFEFSDIENCTYTEIISLGNVFGCTDSTMTNYNQYANTNDGSYTLYMRLY